MTFAENAVIKARSYAESTHLWTLSDDSGLEVHALGGAPGVYSARYGGRGLSYDERIKRLLDELLQTGSDDRRARFVFADERATARVGSPQDPGSAPMATVAGNGAQHHAGA